jgi:prepilin-type N-terminal cleavage/methylation domain-containing protein
MHERNDIGTIRRLARLEDARARQGFTLIELIVAIALFLTIMAGVGLVFVAATRSMRISFQAQEAFEVARGALGIMERDLTRAVTSRDHGDYHNFYGTPIGFSFIGLTSPNQSSRPNIARITYVMHATADSRILPTIDEQERRVFTLLRYVEPGISDLESFPIDWANALVLDPSLTDVTTVQDLIGDPLDPASSAVSSAVARAVLAGICESTDERCLNEVVKARKRELWIRMLSGGDAALPSFWGQNPPIDGPDPLDYALAENILFVANNINFVPQISDGDFAAISFTRPPFFTYRQLGERIRVDAANNTMYQVDAITGIYQRDFFDELIPQRERAPIQFAYWNDTRNMDLANNGIDDDGDFVVDEVGEGFGTARGPGSPLSPRLPLDVAIRFTLFFPSPYVGSPDFVRTFDERIDLPTGFARGQ